MIFEIPNLVRNWCVIWTNLLGFRPGLVSVLRRARATVLSRVWRNESRYGSRIASIPATSYTIARERERRRAKEREGEGERERGRERERTGGQCSATGEVIERHKLDDVTTRTTWTPLMVCWLMWRQSWVTSLRVWSLGDKIWTQNESDWHQMGQLRDFFRWDFSTFWRSLIWKSPGFVSFEVKYLTSLRFA